MGLLGLGVGCADDDAHLFRDGAQPGDGGGDGDGDGDGDPGDGDGDGDPGDGDGDGDGDPGDGDGDPGDGDGDPGDGDGDGDAELIIPAECDSELAMLGPYDPPLRLLCIGLYSDVEAKELSAGVHPFKPAVELWSDGAEKQRWVYLPPGTQIDVSDRDSWIFPVGTRFFKEFKHDGKRVETRLFWKREDGWARASYAWNDDETAAERHPGGEVDVGGDSYFIPSAKECDQCHKGRTDKALGFESVLLGLEGAEGVTLQDLIDNDKVSDSTMSASHSIGDDGTGKAAAAVGWLHVNCGVSCHNANSMAEGFRSDLRLALSAELADGSELAEADAVRTTISVDAQTPRWNELTRIVPGSPDESLLYRLISMRDPANMRDQMPPIASRVVDDNGIALIEAWISSMER